MNVYSKRLLLLPELQCCASTHPHVNVSSHRCAVLKRLGDGGFVHQLLLFFGVFVNCTEDAWKPTGRLVAVCFGFSRVMLLTLRSNLARMLLVP